ncbi:uncharacterized protein N7482_000164 [Penicillium canariense]|uniref:Uracil-DNA glycosylase-like domain-containing protein n=1 Tax=Penicillium canariense TaxID=189055 RepID=A0A9W9LSW2_9EURO|nr:uncharacterized protein N7482_000164 [Penicillium canariense]KAJ5174287.1 hypothetical protein N7482_000164 [Penicillium canariense]
MASSTISREDSSKVHESSPEPMAGDLPVDRITTFNGKLNRFLLSSSTATRSTSRPTRPSKIERGAPEVKRELPTSDLDHAALNGHRARSVTASPKRQKVDGTISASIAQPPRLTRSRSSTSISQSSSSTTRTTTTTSSPKKSPRRRKSPPTHTPTASDSLLRDTIPPNLTLLLVGVNPGLLTGTTGFAYAHPSNLFWKLLYSSGITSIRHPPSDTYKLPALYSVGNTNIVERPSRDASMLSKAEMDAGVPVLEAKVAAQRPEAVCLVGKSIWEAVWRVRHGRAIRKEEFRYGWQDEAENMGCTAESDWGGAPVFVATTTSGLAAGMSIAEKEAVWAELGAWVIKRRAERGFVASGG